MESTIEHLLEPGGGAIRIADLRQVIGWRNIAWLEEWGILQRVGHHVVASPDPDLSIAGRIRRAEILADRPLIACGPTAAELHGLVVGRGPQVLHVTTEDGWSWRPPVGVRVHQAPPRSPIAAVDGVRVTGLADTAVDMACAGTVLDVLAMLDAASRLGATDDELAIAVDRARGRRGLTKVRIQLPFVDWRSDSPMESRTRCMFLSGGLPAPDLQIAARTRNGMRYLDMGWRKYRVGFDYDGEDFHGLDHLVGDRRRHNDVLATDWKLFSLTAVDVFRTPGATVGQAAEALRKQGWKPASGRPFQATDIPRPAGPPSELLQLSRFRWSTANTQT